MVAAAQTKESIKQRESEKIEMRPSVNSPPTPVGTSGQSPTIHVKNSPYLTLQSSLRGARCLGERRRQNVSIEDTPFQFDSHQLENIDLSAVQPYSSGFKMTFGPFTDQTMNFNRRQHAVANLNDQLRVTQSQVTNQGPRWQMPLVVLAHSQLKTQHIP